MADKKSYSGYTTLHVTVPAFSVMSIDYKDTKPNYFRVSNNGAGMLYASTTKNPTATQYDFAIRPAAMQMFAEPFFRDRLYLYNPTGSDINAVVLTFAAEFEPLTLALSGIEILMPDEITSTSAISSFSCSLPAGVNKIGKVDVENLPALPSGNNTIGKVSLTGALPAGTNMIGHVVVDNVADITGGKTLADIVAACNSIVEKLTAAESTRY